MTEAAQFIQDLAVIMIAAALAGLLCKRIGLSPIVGYLVAGIIVGPFTPPYSFVADVNRVRLFAELGLVFLMFGIGLTFSLRRLRQLGLPVLFGALGTAFIVFTVARMTGGALGLDRVGSIFFAALLVVSSSAVIGKILTESGTTHEKSSQLALGVTLAEDIVAIVALTLLGSYTRFGGAAVAGAATEAVTEVTRTPLVTTLALFAGFVLVLATLGLLLVPRVLRRLSRDATSELETIFVAGLLFGLSLMVVRAGYSLALGAFLLGAIIAETPQRAHVDRAFAGLRDMFGAIFFVAIGMSIDVMLMPEAIGPLVALTLLALVGRAAAAGVALVLLGHDTRTAIRAGLIVTPIGEFSFIIARMGAEDGLLPHTYMAAAVGASLLTALFSPMLVRHSGAIMDVLSRRRVPVLSRLLELHRNILDSLQRPRKGSVFWKLTRKRFVQIGVEVALVSTALIFARPVIGWAVRWIGLELMPGVPTAVVCWSALGLLLLAPLIAVWRNIHAVAMIVADYLAQQGPMLARARPLVTTVLQTVTILLLVLWLWNFVPVEGSIWLTVGVLVFLALVAALLWRRMIFWHSSMEVSLESSLGVAPEKPAHAWIDRYAPWGLHIGEVALPDRFAYAGRSIGDIGLRTRFGCSVISVERQGFTLANPGPAAHLFPGDRVLVLGTEEQISAVREYLLTDRTVEADEDTFRDFAVELVEVAEGSRATSRTLGELNWPRLLGIQVVGHERGAVRTLTPSGDLRVEAGDRLLVLGTPVQVKTLREWLEP